MSSTMALARAFTKRAKRHHHHHHEDSSAPSETTFRYAAGTIERSKISLPKELLSTTNVHALSAPDIQSMSSNSSNASLRSADGSEFSSISRAFINTPATSPETSSAESSPISPEPSQRKGFFDTLPQRSATSATTRSSASTAESGDHPILPQRAPSHSKKAHQELARNRSSSRLTPPPTTLSNSTIIRNSAEMFGGGIVDSNHPFGNELAQVNEVAEEFGGADALLDVEERELRMKGLIKYNADDYVNEILGMWGGRLGGGLTGMASPWI